MKLVSIPANPAPEGAVVTMLKAPDGVSLRAARWAPPPGRKGTVCLFQGRAEFIEKYFETVRELHARGFAVATLDWRGQGLSDRALSDRRKGYIENFSQYDTDLSAFMKQVVLPDCPPPYFALAHSMGSAPLLRAAQRGERWFDRMVFTAPLIGLAATPFGRLSKPLARILRLLGFGTMYVPGAQKAITGAVSFADNIVTSDPVRYARNVAVLEAEPDLAIGPPTVAWADAAFRVMAQYATPGYAGRIRQPILMVAAGRDKVTSTAATEEFSIHLRAGTHLILAGANHEILMEQDQYRQQFWAAFDAYVPGSPLFG
jgi:lysophospholipase